MFLQMLSVLFLGKEMQKQVCVCNRHPKEEGTQNPLFLFHMSTVNVTSESGHSTQNLTPTLKEMVGMRKKKKRCKMCIQAQNS